MAAMKQVTVQVLVRNEDDRDVVLHLDVPPSEVDDLITAVVAQCEDYEAADLGPGDEDEDDYDDDEDYDDDDGDDEYYEDEDEYY